MVWVSVYFTTDLIQTGVDLRRTIFRMKVAFGIFVKFFEAFFKTSKRGSIGIPYHNTVQRNRSWNEILDGFPPISNNTKHGSFYSFAGILNHRLKES